jgi:hypothetical protein
MRSAQRKPRGERSELFVLRPRRTKRAAQLGDSAHQLSPIETEYLSGAVQEFLLFDPEIVEAAASGRMEKRFAEEFAVRSVNQRVGSKNLVQLGKRPARSK